MNIDRHNYEEYFLLYIDNELTVDQKRQVELFVQENPDLEEELVMLKQSRLIPDDSIVFDKKHLLMKGESAQRSSDLSFINLNNYEQWLIMYVDDELNAEERASVEKFASAHQHVQQELELFQQTKLQPEEIAFPDKEVLYRREKAVRVISMQWWKVAVAAVLVISAGITLYSIFNQQSNKAITPDAIAKKEQTPAPVSTTSPGKDDQTAAVLKQDKEQTTVTNSVDKQLSKEKKRQEEPEQENNQQLAYNPPPIESVAEVLPTTVEIDKATTEQARMKDDIAFETHKGNINTDAVTNPVIQTPNGGRPGGAVDPPGDGTENKKFRGFFRKATRILERTTSINAADDDKVLIGGMAINLK
jgi:hypothetical protein